MKFSITLTERLPPHLMAPGAPARRLHSNLPASAAAAVLREIAASLETQPLLRANGCLEIVLQRAAEGGESA